jgi:hypothetical protein
VTRGSEQDLSTVGEKKGAGMGAMIGTDPLFARSINIHDPDIITRFPSGVGLEYVVGIIFAEICLTFVPFECELGDILHMTVYGRFFIGWVCRVRIMKQNKHQ